eukprot:340403_1
MLTYFKKMKKTEGKSNPSRLTSIDIFVMVAKNIINKSIQSLSVDDLYSLYVYNKDMITDIELEMIFNELKVKGREINEKVRKNLNLIDAAKSELSKSITKMVNGTHMRQKNIEQMRAKCKRAYNSEQNEVEVHNMIQIFKNQTPDTAQLKSEQDKVNNAQRQLFQKLNTLQTWISEQNTVNKNIYNMTKKYVSHENMKRQKEINYDLNYKIEILQRKLEIEKQELNDYKEKYNTANCNIKTLQQEWFEIQSQHNHKIQILQRKLESEKQSLKNQFKSEKQSLKNQFKSEKQSLKNQFKSEKLQLQKELNEYKQKLISKEQIISTWKDKYNKANESFDELQKEFKTSNNGLKIEIDELHHDKNTLNKKITELHDKINQKEKAVESQVKEMSK